MLTHPDAGAAQDDVSEQQSEAEVLAAEVAARSVELALSGSDKPATGAQVDGAPSIPFVPVVPRAFLRVTHSSLPML